MAGKFCFVKSGRLCRFRRHNQTGELLNLWAVHELKIDVEEASRKKGYRQVKEYSRTNARHRTNFKLPSRTQFAEKPHSLIEVYVGIPPS